MTNIFNVKEEVKEQFLTRANVVGVGVGFKVTKGKTTNKEAIVVLVEKKLPKRALSVEDILPLSIGDVRAKNNVIVYSTIPVDVVEVGKIEALSYAGRYRPAPGGVSIGHYKITAGTFGALVYDKLTEQPLILSNNHVLANSNDAILGDTILQPGPIDGGNIGDDVIAELERFVPIDFGEDDSNCPIADNFVRATNYLTGLVGSQHRVRAIKQNQQATNFVDAAVARPIINSDVKDEILDIGKVNGQTNNYFLGMEVEKTGRTTEHTKGVITLINATVTVGYGGNKLAVFEDQIITNNMSQGGDSGSLLVSSSSKEAIGLLFAGSNQATIHNPIQYVTKQLEIKF